MQLSKLWGEESAVYFLKSSQVDPKDSPRELVTLRWCYDDAVNWRNDGVIVRCTLHFRRALRGLNRAIRTCQSGNFESETRKGQSKPTSPSPIHSIWPRTEVQTIKFASYNFSNNENRPQPQPAKRGDGMGVPNRKVRWTLNTRFHQGLSWRYFGKGVKNICLERDYFAVCS